MFNKPVRFFPDGRFAFASSVEPGVALFDAQRHLIRTWRTEGLGYEDRCTVTPEQSQVFGGDLVGRLRWINRRQLLDEMLTLPDGVLLIIRTPRPKGTAWRAVLLPFDGEPVGVEIPLSSPSPYAHVRADVRNNRIVFLVDDSPPEDVPRVPGRVVIARIHQ